MAQTAVLAFDEGRVATAAGLGTDTLQCSSRNWPVNLLASGYVVAVHGQLRRVIANTADTLQVSLAWTAAIAAGETYVIIPLAPSGDEAVGGLAYYGVVTAVPAANQFTIPTLAGLGAGKFSDVTAPYWAFVLRDAGGAGAVPQGQTRAITAYVTATGVFTTVAFGAAVAVGDEVLLLHPRLAEIATVLASLGLMADVATADSLADVATTSAQAKLRRLLLRLSPDAFTADIQGAARTELDTMLAQLATYISALGAAYSATVNPGAAAKTNIEQTLEDVGDMLAGATGIVTWPAAAVPGNGVSIAEVLRQIYNDVVALVGTGILHEQADTPVTINAIAGGETDVLNLAVAATRYVVRSLRLKCADPGANTVTVRLYELVNDVPTVVDTFSMTTANFGTAHSLMDLFGLAHLAGDQLRVTVQASAGGPYAVLGQFSHALAT